LITIPLQNSKIVLKLFELFENRNPIVVEDVCASNPKNRKKTFDIDVNRKLQNVWVLKMPWVEPIFQCTNLVISFKCHVYFKIEKKENFW
jgi:hypothetical protein